ncbi:hypothetical protein EVAR_51937_1 [Eumeta japonica]|uniref:Uncharacterized protein n=1 Tax=Eumeta variegata TaxID=151549 RepID=A0A4C1YGZ8_EUMVA|nr:hypothetical protein EVAR_51937_1 [Eumeta japonica]
MLLHFVQWLRVPVPHFPFITNSPSVSPLPLHQLTLPSIRYSIINQEAGNALMTNSSGWRAFMNGAVTTYILVACVLVCTSEKNFIRPSKSLFASESWECRRHAFLTHSTFTQTLVRIKREWRTITKNNRSSKKIKQSNRRLPIEYNVNIGDTRAPRVCPTEKRHVCKLRGDDKVRKHALLTLVD